MDAYDDPTAEADLAVFRSKYGLGACTTQNGCFRKVNEWGTTSPMPAQNLNWEMEIALDIDAVSALCPNCHILLVEAQSNGADLTVAEARAAAMGATQISNSWGSQGGGNPASGFSFPGVAVVAGTGDWGYNAPGSDFYPAAYPGVIGAGGTTIAGSNTTRGFTESAWNLNAGWGGGTGCATSQLKPAYQTDKGCAGRSYSDISADGNPSSGLLIYDSGNGGTLQVGGTSLASPLIAAYYALVGANPQGPGWAYANSSLLNDPLSGSVGSCAANISYICNVGAGYDGPTGAGSISGAVVTGAPGLGGPPIGSGYYNTYTQSVTGTSAVLAAGVYPNGLPTSYFWQYGPTNAYGQQTPSMNIGSGTAPVPTTDTLSSLLCSTYYHYRLVAQNSLGTSYGYDYALQTSASACAPVNTHAAGNHRHRPQGLTLSAETVSGQEVPSLYSEQWQRNSGQAGSPTSPAPPARPTRCRPPTSARASA